MGRRALVVVGDSARWAAPGDPAFWARHRDTLAAHGVRRAAGRGARREVARLAGRAGPVRLDPAFPGSPVLLVREGSERADRLDVLVATSSGPASVLRAWQEDVLRGRGGSLQEWLDRVLDGASDAAGDRAGDRAGERAVLGDEPDAEAARWAAVLPGEQVTTVVGDEKSLMAQVAERLGLPAGSLTTDPAPVRVDGTVVRLLERLAVDLRELGPRHESTVRLLHREAVRAVLRDPAPDTSSWPLDERTAGRLAERWPGGLHDAAAAADPDGAVPFEVTTRMTMALLERLADGQLTAKELRVPPHLPVHRQDADGPSPKSSPMSGPMSGPVSGRAALAELVRRSRPRRARRTGRRTGEQPGQETGR